MMATRFDRIFSTPVVIVVFCLICLFAGGSFRSGSPYRTQGMTIPLYCMDSSSLDIDNDGDWDLVTGHKGYGTGLDDTLTVYVNHGDMYYTQTYYVGNTPNDAVCTGDFNSDGYVDIATACWNNSIGIYYNDHQGGFGSFVRISSTRGGSILKSVDIEGDGDQDLFYMSNNPNFGHYFGFYRNHGTGFSNYLHTNEACSEDYLSLNDIDRDGVIDVISGGRIYLNRGDHFEQLLVPSDIVWAPATSSGDYDADGDIDLIIIAPTTPMSVTIYENLGDNTFQTHSEFAVAPGYFSWMSPVVVQDLNSDGYADIAYMNMVEAPVMTDMFLHILINQGGTGFTSQSIHFDRLETIFWFNMLEIADLNSDGARDIVISSVAPNDSDSYWQYMLFVMQTGDGLFEQVVANDDPTNSPVVSDRELSTYPNPMILSRVNEMKIRFPQQIPGDRDGEREIRIFNTKGQLVRTLHPQREKEIIWDCLDNKGRILPSGVYLLQYRVGNTIVSTTKTLIF